jgi:hypothetical protein
MGPFSNIMNGRGEETYTWETDSAITAFGLSGGFLDVVVDELAAGCFDDAPAVGGGVVGVAFAEGDALGHFFIPTSS